MPKHPDEHQWDESTPADSLKAMRKAIEANTATCNAGLEWAVKTYHLVAPLSDRVAHIEKKVERIEAVGFKWPLLAASLAVAASFVGLACELMR